MKLESVRVHAEDKEGQQRKMKLLSNSFLYPSCMPILIG